MAGGATMAHLVFGIIGNIISFLVFLAPITTFRQVYRKKSTGGFSSVPYVVALFSSTLWIFYALVKKNSTLLLSINTVGCGIEAAYVLMYLVYAPKKAKLRTLAYFLLLDVAAFALIVVVTKVFITGPHQVKFLGSVCLAFSMAVFVAPMSIIFKVVKTKSVEFMPFYLSLFLTMSSVAWFGYGFFSKDPYVMYPNVGGFFFSCIQMGLYFFYRKPKATVLPTTTDNMGNVTQGEVIELQPGHTLTILSAGPIAVLDMHKIEPVEQEAPGKEETKEKDMNADKEIIEIIAV